jgi:hypothetical protein
MLQADLTRALMNLLALALKEFFHDCFHLRWHMLCAT